MAIDSIQHSAITAYQSGQDQWKEKHNFPLLLLLLLRLSIWRMMISEGKFQIRKMVIITATADAGETTDRGERGGEKERD